MAGRSRSPDQRQRRAPYARLKVSVPIAKAAFLRNEKKAQERRIAAETYEVARSWTKDRLHAGLRLPSSERKAYVDCVNAIYDAYAVSAGHSRRSEKDVFG